jgi:uncharacterized membrane protein YhhN
MLRAMTASAVLLLTLTAVVAVLDWLAVGTGRRGAELMLKPLTMVGLVAVALALDTSDTALRIAVLVALVLSLAGDVFLMVRRDLFVAGLASFLAAHVAYTVALVVMGALGVRLFVGLLGVAVAVLVLGVRIVRGARAQDPVLAGPVMAYLVVISLMVACAAGTGHWLALAGAVLFYVSDAVLGWTRFVADFGHSRVVVMVTYHLGQALLVLGIL